MSYARKVDGAWTEVVGPFVVGEGLDAIQYPPSWLEGAEPDQLAELGAVAIVEEAPPAPALQALGQALVDVADVPHRRWVLPPVADVRAARRAEVAALRWTRQQTVQWNGRAAQADDATLGRLMAAVMRSQLAGNPAFAIRWKFGDGDFATLGLAEITGYGIAIGTHLQACYDREAELVAAINAAATPEAVCAIDVARGWPA